MKREQKIETGEMTRAQAIKEDEEWQEVRFGKLYALFVFVVDSQWRCDKGVARLFLKSDLFL